MDLDALERGYQQSLLKSKMRAASEVPVVPQKKPWYTAGISEGGALAGGATGAAIGSVVPGLGTVIGGVIGAGLGAFGGRLAENKVRDNRWGVGDALVEGGTSTLLSALAPAAGSAKAALAGRNAIGAADDVVKASAKATTRSGLERASQLSLGNAWGVRSGVKLKGTTITPQRVGKLQDFIVDELKVPKRANADQVLEYAANHKSTTGEAISNLLGGSNGVVDTKKLASALKSRFNGVIGAGGAGNPVADDILKQVKAAKTPKDLWTVRQSIDDLINFGANDASATPGAQQIARMARKEINSIIESSTPAYKQLASSYSKANDVIELAGQAARTPKGLKIPGMNATLAGPQTQQLRALAGNAARTASQVPRSLSAALASPAGQGAKNAAIGQIVQAPFQGGTQGQNMDTTMQMTTNQINNSTIASPVNTQTEEMSMGEQIPYSRENLMYDIQRDPKNRDKYINYYKDIQEIFAAPETKGLNSTAAGTVTDLQNGISNIRQLSDDFAASGVNNPGIGWARSKNPFDTDAQTLQANIARVKQVIGKALEGGVLRKEDEIKYAKILPTLNDTDAVAQNKIQAIADDLDRKLYLYQQNLGTGNGGVVADQSLMQALGGL